MLNMPTDKFDILVTHKLPINFESDVTHSTLRRLLLKFKIKVEKCRSGNSMIYNLASLLLSCATQAIKISGMLHKNRHICIGGNITVVKRK